MERTDEPCGPAPTMPSAAGGKTVDVWPWSRRQQWYALAVLFALGLVNYIDRVSFSVLQVPIKAELGLSDAELGTLSGFTFFVPYLVLSVPMARVADRWNRKYLLMAALALWSSMTALTGLAHGFWMIVVLRMGVAIGEACCLPTAYSLLADYFRPGDRARAIAVFGMAYSVGSMIGLSGAGLLEQRLGWQGAFGVIGALGLAFLPVLAFTFREPPRGGSAVAATAEAPPAFGEALLILWRLRSFRYITAAASLQTFVAVTILFWSAPFYVRSHAMPLAWIAVALGLIVGVGGALGTLAGGLLGDRLGRRDRRWYVWLPALSSALTVPFGLAQFLAASPEVSLAFAALTVVFLNMWLSPTYTITQSLVRPTMRALISATLVTSTAIVSGAIGPSVIGTVSDWLALRHGWGSEALRVTISASLSISVLVAVLYGLAGRHIRTDAAALDA